MVVRISKNRVALENVPLNLSAAAINEARSNIAQHATAMDFWAAGIGSVLDGTGSAVTITACANAPQAGASRKFYPLVDTVLTHGATFDIDGNVNQTAVAGDCWEIVAITTSTYKVHVTVDTFTHVRATRTTVQAISNNLSTVLAFATVDYDTRSEFDVVTNVGRFTAKSAGYYRVSSAAVTESVAWPAGANVYWTIEIFKNGTLFQGTGNPGGIVSTTNVRYSQIEATVYLAANDFITIKVEHINGSAINVAAPGAYGNAYITIDRLP